MSGRLSSIRVVLLVLILLAIVPGVGATLYNAQEQRRQDASSAQQQALTLARSASVKQEQLIAEAHQSLSYLANQPELQRSDAGACNAYLAEARDQYASFANIVVAELNGEPYCSSIPPEATNVANLPLFQRIIQDQGFAIGDYQLGPTDGRASLGFGHPVIDQNGRLKGVIVAGLDLSWLNAFKARTEIPPGSTLIVADRNGTILARYPDDELWIGRSMEELPLFLSAVADGDGEGVAEANGLDGIPKLYAFTQLAGPTESGEVYVFIGIPESAAYAYADQALRRNLGSFGIAIILALGIAWLGTDLFIMRRVQALVAATQRLASGDFQARSGLDRGGGELGVLSSAFDRMAQELEAREEDRAERMREQARREEAEASQEHIASIVEGISDAFFAVDSQWRFTFLNSKATQVIQQFTNKTDQELPGKNIWQELPEFKGTPFYDQCHLAMSQQVALQFEEFYPQIKAWIEVHVHPTRDGLSIFFQDITGRKQAEDTERRFAEENEALAEIGRFVSSSLDINQVFQGFAHQVRRLIPFDRISISLINAQEGTTTTAYALGHEVPGLVVGSTRSLAGSLTEQVMVARRGILIQGKDQEQLLRLYPSAAQGVQAGLVSAILVPLVSQDQVIGALMLRSFQPDCYSPAHVSLAERIGVQIGGTITSAQLHASLARAEQEAQRERQRLQSVLETMPVGILVVDGEERVLFANQEMERIMGFAYTFGQPVGEYAPVVVALRKPEGYEVETLPCPLHHALATGEKLRAEEINVELRDGRRVPVLANATPIVASDGAIIGGILAFQDMTVLEQAQHARREFLGVVSHEMRNPLAVIQMSAATALVSGQSLDLGEVHELFQAVNDEAKRLKNLVNDLLDINQIESGTLSVEPAPLDLRDVLESMHARYARTNGIHALAVETPGYLPLVWGDRDRIEQVLLNLVGNAAKFSPGSTPITLQVDLGPTEVTVHVCDKGVGIPPEQLPMLFHKFTRLHTPGAAQAEGTGLGLAICKGIIEAHGGRIWAESFGEERGSTFSFTLPLAPAESSAPVSSSS